MLSADEVDVYRRDGFALARHVFSPGELSVLGAESDRLWGDASANLEHPSVYWRKHETLGRIADRLDPVATMSPLFASIAADSRMHGLASSAIGASSAFMKDKLITKPPGTFGYTLHHDFAYWTDLGIPADELVTLFLALDAVDEANGGIELFPRLHKSDLRAHPDDPYDLDPVGIEGHVSTMPVLEAGDVLLFHSLIPHRSAPNRSGRSRRVYVVTYFNACYVGRFAPLDKDRRKVVYRTLARENV